MTCECFSFGFAVCFGFRVASCRCCNFHSAVLLVVRKTYRLQPCDIEANEANERTAQKQKMNENTHFFFALLVSVRICLHFCEIIKVFILESAACSCYQIPAALLLLELVMVQLLVKINFNFPYFTFAGQNVYLDNNKTFVKEAHLSS